MRAIGSARRRWTTTTGAVFGALVWLGCNTPTGPGDLQTELDVQRARWNRSGIVNYQLTLLRSQTFTASAPLNAIATTPVVVQVRDGRVVQRTFATTGIAVEASLAETWPTVDGLFDLIQAAIDQQAVGLAVRYDEEFDYPSSIQIDFVAGRADDEQTIRVLGFTPFD